ncbi:MAG: Transcriptional regulator AraC family protein [Limisphaerales bacterium]|nr:MAG: Transcriptional regulator AraC family protein [Limisphaerales bacterium]KAG0509461.1 MAG: Transcriptional regulator AraC family protein [Limisphaerales bacterium]TXT52298.1 MAG: Transcriptional regulator AraC family protein [Limisphaerales bacterium]
MLAERSGWDVPAAAELLNVSLRQLERLSQRELGCTPTEWMQCERMAAAVRLLATGQPVKVVAMNLGYTRSANFSRDFKRHFGRNPRTFAPHSLFGLTFGSYIAGKEQGSEG